jgi:hypothetical protein
VLANPLITDLSEPILVQFVLPKVTPSEHQLVLQAAMEANVATSSRIPHTPILATTTGGIFPPHLGWGKPQFWKTKPCAWYYSYTARK